MIFTIAWFNNITASNVPQNIARTSNFAKILLRFYLEAGNLLDVDVVLSFHPIQEIQLKTQFEFRLD